MTSRRDILLEEMGLAPTWRLRREDTSKSEGKAEKGALKPVSSGPAAQSPEAKVRHSKVSTQDSLPDERVERILRMDWTELKAVVSDCQACGLHTSRNKTVFGVGDEQADWLLIGEAPGAEEDTRGEPFVGQAGRLLDNMLAAVGLARGENVYIANVLKCRPPGNRNPEPGEVAKCSPHLTRQIALIQPKLILAMGRFAVQTLLNTEASIASLRGRLHSYQGVPLIVTYHPAYLLRSLPDKAKAWEDLCLARKTMAGLISAVSSPS
jgi:uracil-DNA glycosylase